MTNELRKMTEEEIKKAEEFIRKVEELKPKRQQILYDYERDVVRKALLSGKRVSKSGKKYWETRKNRSDALNSRT